MDLQTNPFSALSFIVAPAVLTNACSVLALGTSNRLARVVDRSRVITEWLKHRRPDPHEGSFAPIEEKEKELSLQELDSAQQRALMLIRALRLFYTALGSFSCCALLSVVGAAALATLAPTLVQVVEAIAFLAGSNGVGCVVAGTLILVKETSMAVQVLKVQISHAEKEYGFH